MGDIINAKQKFKQGWKGGLPETPCGSGSKMANTEKQRVWIPEMIEKYQIKSIADVGAGDLNWIKHTDLKGAEYTPYDLVPRKPEVKQFDLVESVAPKADMILCLWVLNHMPYDDCEKAISNIKASGSKYLMMTDRPKWHDEQPLSILMPAIELIVLNDKNDQIVLIDLGNA